jgi:hypothetical protein
LIETGREQTTMTRRFAIAADCSVNDASTAHKLRTGRYFRDCCTSYGARNSVAPG